MSNHLRGVPTVPRQNPSPADPGVQSTMVENHSEYDSLDVNNSDMSNKVTPRVSVRQEPVTTWDIPSKQDEGRIRVVCYRVLYLPDRHRSQI